MNLNDIPGASVYLTSGEGIPLRVSSFEVFEVPRFIPSGSGDHHWGLLEKYNRNTLGVLKEIAAHGNVDIKDTGYAGLKDKRAHTLQWVSSPAELPRVGRDFQVRFTKKSGRKLRPGNLLGNWFKITIESEDTKEIAERLSSLKQVPNFFGPQRFSKSNHHIGSLLIHGEKKKAIGMMKSQRIPLTRKFFTLMEDAYCSYLFNKILTSRMSHLEPQKGDLLSGGVPTGPIFGKKVPLASGIPGSIEKGVLEAEGLSLNDFPGNGKRRRLWIPLKGLSTFKNVFQFFLPKGSYATAVLREISKKQDITWSVC